MLRFGANNKERKENDVSNIVVCAAALAFICSTATAQADIGRDPKPDVERAMPQNVPKAAPKRPEVELSRGQLLYENDCRGCHESVVHVREQRKASTPAAVEAWVRRWSGELRLGWGDDEVRAVSRYLGERYYKFQRTQ